MCYKLTSAKSKQAEWKGNLNNWRSWKREVDIQIEVKKLGEECGLN
jgi:hypothetical protein